MDPRLSRSRPVGALAPDVPRPPAARLAARRLLAADMQSAAERAGSVISAALFGALAASGALPFTRAAVEAHWQDSEYLKDDFALLVVRMK